MKLICHTETSPASNGTRPFRVVLRYNPDNQGGTPYVVHMETDPETDKSGYHNGDYCVDEREANNAFVARCQRYGLTQRFYPEDKL